MVSCQIHGNGGIRCELVSMVVAEGTMASAVHWMAELGVQSVFGR